MGVLRGGSALVSLECWSLESPDGAWLAHVWVSGEKKYAGTGVRQPVCSPRIRSQHD